MYKGEKKKNTKRYLRSIKMNIGVRTISEFLLSIDFADKNLQCMTKLPSSKHAKRLVWGKKTHSNIS